MRMKIQAEWGRASGPYSVPGALLTAENSSFAASLPAQNEGDRMRERERGKKKPSIERDERKKEK